MGAFPGALAVFAGFTATHTLKDDNHSAQHNLEQAEILAAQTKIGTGSSTETNNTVLRGDGVGTSSWGQVVLTTDVTNTLPLANGGVGVTTLADFKATYLALLYPVGSIYINATNATNPGTLLGFGTWVAWGQGKVTVGLDSTDTSFDSAEETGGAKTHTHALSDSAYAQLYVHDVGGNSFFDARTISAGVTAFTSSERVVSAGVTSGVNSTEGVPLRGATDSTSNLPPYITAYLWKRTA